MPQLTTLPDAALFRTSKTTHSASDLKVDRKGKVIRGASMMQLGDVNDDRPWTVDEDTLESAAQFANQSSKGLKARFTHPSMSNDGMGSYLGRWQNVHREGDHLRGDLHIAEAAFSSPRGDIGTYVLDLADEDPEAFGVSLATRLNFEEMDKLAEEQSDEERTPLRFASLRAGDIVDEPAATRGGLFDVEEVDLRLLPDQASQILDAYFGDAEPEIIRGRVNSFLAKYLKNKGFEMAEQTETTSTEDLSSNPADANADAPVPAAQEPEVTQTADLSEKELERQRIKQIKALCELSGAQDKFSLFVDNDFTVEQTQFALKDLMPKRNTVVSEVDKTPDQQKSDPHADLKAEYADAVKHGVHLGMTEEDWIKYSTIPVADEQAK